VEIKKPYWQALTFGRFRIPHLGHADLVRNMMEQADVSFVFMSSAPGNGDLALRKKLLYRCMEIIGAKAGCGFSITEERNPWSMAKQAFEVYGYDRAASVIYLGSDQHQMAQALARDFDTNYLLNRRLGSSTAIRHLIDQGLEADLLDAYHGDKEAVEMAKRLREQELEVELCSAKK
jgi:hypothetical protein